jgi:hypothetical protein
MAAGAVVVGVGTYLILQAQSDQSSADSALSKLQEEQTLGPCFNVAHGAALLQAAQDECQARYDHANDLSNDAKIMKWAGWATVGVGGAAIVTGVILRIVADDMNKVTVAASPQLQPFAWTQPQGGGFGILGRF